MEKNRDYIIYTNNRKNSNGDLEVFFARYDSKSPTFKFIKIEDGKEYKKLKIIFEELCKQFIEREN